MKFRFLSSYLIVALAISGVILPFKALAASADDILADIAPPNPAPSENTTITLSSYGYNLDGVLTTWSVNGKNAASGIGKKSFSLTAPAAGAETTVTATLALPDGRIDKKIIIRPSVMVLLWQAEDSYVPPFYKGKALPAPDSQVKVVAMPEIKTGSGMVNPNNMVYAWQQDYTNDQGASGYGKNFYVYTNDYLDKVNTIGVTASTIDQNYSSEASINIGTSQPKIDFYKNDAKLGTVWENALSDGHKIQGDEVMQAAPYFISPRDIRIPSLIFNWFINGEQVAVNSFSKNLMPLQTQAGTSGTSTIKLEIDNQDKIFETASKEINVQF